jgi:hypothetical protein
VRATRPVNQISGAFVPEAAQPFVGSGDAHLGGDVRRGPSAQTTLNQWRVTVNKVRGHYS